MIRVPTRFASMRPAPGTAWAGRPDGVSQAGAVPSAAGGAGGLARPGAFVWACAVLALAAGSVRVLATGNLSPGAEVAGIALLAGTVLAYLKVMWGRLTDLGAAAQLVNLATLLALVACAPIPLGQGFLPLEFVLPAAVLAAVSWPVGLWLAAGSLVVPAVTAVVFGYPAGAIFRQVAQAAALAVAVAGLVKLAAQARELGRVKADLAQVSRAHDGTTQRLRQGDELLGALGWRLAVISRMSELASRAGDRRPGLAGRELDQVRELACEWPGGSESPAEAGPATTLSAEIHAARKVLLAAGVQCAAGPIPAGLGGNSGDALAFGVHEAAACILARPGAQSCTITVSDDGARIRLVMEWDEPPDAPSGSEAPDAPDRPVVVAAQAWAEVAARVAACNGECEATVTNGRSVFRVNIPKSADW
jgi:hypothetical protein